MPKISGRVYRREAGWMSVGTGDPQPRPVLYQGQLAPGGHQPTVEISSGSRRTPFKGLRGSPNRPSAIEKRVQKVSEEEFARLLSANRIRPASSSDIEGKRKRALYRHPLTGAMFISRSQ